MIEVELKFKIPCAVRFEQQLVDSATNKFVAETHAQDFYFNHSVRDFAITDECLRLRVVDGQSNLTWKGPSADGQAQIREEIEFAIAAEAGLAKQFLTALSFKPVATVTKIRRIYERNFETRKVQVCLDRVEELGDFVELELMSEDDSTEALNCLMRLSAVLQLTKIESQTYLDLLLARRSSEGS